MPTTQDETQEELYSERRPRQPLLPAAPDPAVQRKRMLIALGVLLVALVAVVLKDWDFWFPSSEEVTETSTPRKRPATGIAAASASSTTATRNDRKFTKPSEPDSGTPFRAIAERAALPALQVEVVAGNRHTTVAARSSAIHLDLGSGAATPAAEAPAPRQEAVVSAADRVQLSPQTAQNVTVSVPPDYPLLARQMKVQGAVILQALISREGSIQELQIVSGPGILATAAREAVKQWRFKPYYQSGQPVETQARITVNFTISTN